MSDTAPDRPTREQVDAAIAMCGTPVSGDHPAVYRAHTLAAEVTAWRAEQEGGRCCDARPSTASAVTWSRMLRHQARRVAAMRAEVRALRAELAEVAHARDGWLAASGTQAEEIDRLRATMAARTPQSAAGQVAAGASLTCCDDGTAAYPDACPSCGDWVAAAEQAETQTSPAPLPAVPDGEEAEHLRDQLDRAHALNRKQHRELVQLTMVPPVPFGEDVPSRLAAAAEVLGEISGAAAGDFRHAANVLAGASPEMRAAVAAALARPTGADQNPT
jgi:hypothetical protein